MLECKKVIGLFPLQQNETKSEEQQQDDDVPLGTKGLDELIEYINGTDINKKVNSKSAAKRARQKLKKVNIFLMLF